MLLCLLFFQMSSKTDWPSSFWFEGGKNYKIIVGILYCLWHSDKNKGNQHGHFYSIKNCHEPDVQATKMLQATNFLTIFCMFTFFFQTRTKKKKILLKNFSCCFRPSKIVNKQTNRARIGTKFQNSSLNDKKLEILSQLNIWPVF